MKQIAITAIMIIVIAYGLMLSFYDIKFNTGGYDIIFSSRRNYNYGWGVKHREGFELWRFAENAHSGSSENIVYPKYPEKQRQGNWQFWIGLLVAVSGISLRGIYTKENDNLIKDIEELIRNCKSCESFDERSEYKMPGWLEFSEGKLHRRSLFTLRRIRKEMQRYYKIHLDMDLEEDFGIDNIRI